VNLRAAVWLTLWAVPRLARAAETSGTPSDASSETVPQAHVVVNVAAHDVPPATASTTMVTSRELEAVPYRTAEDALRLVPGVTLVQHGSEGKGQQYFLRGFDATHGADFEIVVGGVPINEWSNVHGQGYLDLGFLIPETIAAVIVTKGPFTLEQGAFAMAGSADYRLGIAPEHRGLRTAYTLGTTGRQRGLLTFSPDDRDGSSFLGLEAVYDPGFGHRRGVARGAVTAQVRALDSPTHGALALWCAGGYGQFELPGALRNEDVTAGEIGFYDAYDPTNQGSAGRAILAAEYRVRRRAHAVTVSAFGGYRTLRLEENYTGWLLDPEEGDTRAQSQDAWSFGGEVGYRWRLRRTLVLDLAAEVRGDALQQQQAHVRDSDGHETPERALAGLQVLAGLRTGAMWRPVPALELRAGVRIDVAVFDVRDELAPGEAPRTAALVSAAPRLHAMWSVSPRWSVLAAYGRGFRPPEARAIVGGTPPQTGISEDVDASAEVRTTYADAWELGLRAEPHRVVGLHLAGFATVLDRESIFDHVSGVNLDLDGSRRLGAEFVLEVRPLSWLSVRGDVTYTHARFATSGRPIPFAPPWVGGVLAMVSHRSGLRAGLHGASFSSRPLPHGARGAPYFVLDATVGFRWMWLDLDLAVENVLNRELRAGEYHFASRWDRDASSTALPVLHFSAGSPIQARFTLTTTF